MALANSSRVSFSFNSQTSLSSQTSSEVCGGYGYDFVEAVHPRFSCPLCARVMREPQLVVCCGQKFCLSCLKNFRSSQNDTCPHCKAHYGPKHFHYVAEKGMKSEIESFSVHCPTHGKGCDWKGVLTEVESHLLSDNGCGFLEVECPNKCQVRKNCTLKLQRRNLPSHLGHHCELRQVKCPHCDYTDTYKAYTIHQAICAKFPVKCPNGCGESDIIRQLLGAHRLTCRCEVVLCQYASLGCKGRAKREDMHHHMADNRERHLEMITTENSRLKRELEDMEHKMKNLTSEVAERKSAVQQELLLLNRVSSDALWLKSLNTHFKDSRCLTEGELYFRMFQYGEIRSGIKDWNSPTFMARDSSGLMYLHVSSGPNMDCFRLQICLSNVSIKTLPLRWTDMLFVKVQSQGSAAAPQASSTSSGSKLRGRRASRRGSSLEPLSQSTVQFSWKMPDNISLGDCKREGGRIVLHCFKVTFSFDWENLYVMDDSIVWGVSMTI